MSFKPRTLHEQLSDSKINFVQKLRLAVAQGELDYWWARNNPPNESVEAFRQFLKRLVGPISPRHVPRESSAGAHGRSGEDECFKFQHDLIIFGVKKRYFVKGYFFDKGNLKGVTIQSFREVKRLTLAN
ncbi:MAG: hypothetical protein WCG27_10390 [Pseudomonadota bacterium]